MVASSINAACGIDAGLKAQVTRISAIFRRRASDKTMSATSVSTADIANIANIAAITIAKVMPRRILML